MKALKVPALLLFAIILLNTNLHAQKNNRLTNELLKLSFGRSKHGSGDIRGFSFATEYTRYFKKRLYWSASLGTTIHDGEDEVIYEAFGRQRDGSVRYITAGVQGLFGAGYSVLKNTQHELSASLSAVVRYQTSSLTNRSVLYPIGTGLPIPVVQFDHAGPARTFTIGASLSGGYNYTFNKGLILGFSGAFQADLNSDVLSHLSLGIGKRF